MANKQHTDEVVENCSVKIMLSYDYCHFEIQLGHRESLTIGEVNELRKKAQRLADKAVKQYRTSQKISKLLSHHDLERLREVVAKIEEIPEGERSSSDKAYVNELRQYEYWKDREPYDYEDDDDYDWSGYHFA